ncbi:hypothetical protein RHSIM_Rhsim10G0201600 [Rhododendron simsii]|uniref:Glycoside hydrolase family 19 catalytic domain-containing protein n=1 Tax=Rhododendron simsii TaxID=118357 RepID=A0A834G8X4_RHOSS|nr:hypothetical protein RHSIM_Rhsim10G0201600 [Rhododendron simsii]
MLQQMGLLRQHTGFLRRWVPEQLSHPAPTSDAAPATVPSLVVLQPPEMMIPRRERLLRFWLKLPMKLLVGGQRLRVDHMQGDTVLLRNETRRIIVFLINNGVVLLGSSTTAVVPSKFHSDNYNYGPAGKAIGSDLLANPDLVAAEAIISFRAALWFWITPQYSKPSCHDVITGRWTPSAADLAAGRAPGYCVITNIINGGLECGQGFSTSQQVSQIGFLMHFSDCGSW